MKLDSTGDCLFSTMSNSPSSETFTSSTTCEITSSVTKKRIVTSSNTLVVNGVTVSKEESTESEVICPGDEVKKSEESAQSRRETVACGKADSPDVTREKHPSQGDSKHETDLDRPREETNGGENDQNGEGERTKDGGGGGDDDGDTCDNSDVKGGEGEADPSDSSGEEDSSACMGWVTFQPSADSPLAIEIN